MFYSENHSFSWFWGPRREDCIGPEQDYPEFLKKKFTLEEQKVLKADQFLSGKQIAYLIYDNFRVTCVNRSVLDYADLFSIVLRNDNIQELDRRWDEIFLSMEQFPPDDIVESLYKIRIRDSEKIKTVLELYNINSSGEGETWLSQTDDKGKKRYWAKFEIADFWG